MNMGNALIKKMIGSMFDIDKRQIEMAMQLAQSFNDKDIDKETAIQVFEKLSKKTSKEINSLLEELNGRL